LKRFQIIQRLPAPDGPAAALALKAACLALLALLCWRAAPLFDPASRYVNPFSSDSAIPVLMARGSLHGLFGAYYWGQDRFGSWPFLIGSGWRALTGWSWTPERLALVQQAWLLLGAVVLGSMKPVGSVAASAFVSALVLHPAVRGTVFSTGQPYAWQLTALILSWFLVRQLLSGKRISWAVAPCGLAIFLAIWSSPISSVLLLGIIAIETYRSRELSRRTETTRQLGLRVALAITLLVVSVGAEVLLRLAYHRAAWNTFGDSYETVWRGDRGHFQDNALKLVRVAFDDARWLPLLALVGAAILGVLAVRQRKSQQTDGAELARESFFLASGCAFMALANFLICVGARHVRLNDYSDRYLCLTYIFLDMTVWISWIGIALWVVQRARSARLFPPALALLTLIFTFFWIPVPARNPQYDQLRMVAQSIATQGHSVLLGEYWSVYQLAALSSPDALIPVTPEDEKGPRTPFNVPFLIQAREVRVLHKGGHFLDFDGRPLQRFSQYGVLLEWLGPAVPQSSNALVSVYRNRGAGP